MNEARQGLVGRLRLVERERDALEGARDAAEAYLAKEQECVATQCRIYEARHPRLPPLPLASLVAWNEPGGTSLCCIVASVSYRGMERHSLSPA